jgi:glycosyltransferase involved in cell wall biosynthesis
MEIWFSHRGFPGQYKHLAPYFAKRSDCRVVTLAIRKQPRIEGARQYGYEVPELAPPSAYAFTQDLENEVRHSVEAARLALRLKKMGLRPDIVCSHHSLGDTLFFRDIFPGANFLTYQELFHRSQSLALGFDPEFGGKNDLDTKYKLRMANATGLLSLDLADWNVCPTRWQWAQFPEKYRPKISLIYDGIDTAQAKPNSGATVSLKGRQFTIPFAKRKPGAPVSIEDRHSTPLSSKDEVITYVARNLEPNRGFHIFMRALPELLRRRPKAHVLIVGGDKVSYGVPLPNGETYREKLFGEVRERIDVDRVHFLGRISYGRYLSVLQISSAHVYLTYPFFLSWSMLEAMSAGCMLVASMTPPVEEVIQDGVNGLLFDFLSPEALCETVCRALDDPELARTLRHNARMTILENYDLESICLPRQVELIEKVASGDLPTS